MDSIRAMVEDCPRMKAMRDFLEADPCESERKWAAYIALAPDLAGFLNSKISASASSTILPTTGRAATTTATATPTAPHTELQKDKWTTQLEAAFNDALAALRAAPSRPHSPAAAALDSTPAAAWTASTAAPTATPQAASTRTTTGELALASSPPTMCSTVCLGGDTDADLPLGVLCAGGATSAVINPVLAIESTPPHTCARPLATASAPCTHSPVVLLVTNSVAHVTYEDCSLDGKEDVSPFATGFVVPISVSPSLPACCFLKFPMTSTVIAPKHNEFQRSVSPHATLSLKPPWPSFACFYGEPYHQGAMEFSAIDGLQFDSTLSLFPWNPGGSFQGNIPKLFVMFTTASGGSPIAKDSDSNKCLTSPWDPGKLVVGDYRCIIGFDCLAVLYPPTSITCHVQLSFNSPGVPCWFNCLRSLRSREIFSWVYMVMMHLYVILHTVPVVSGVILDTVSTFPTWQGTEYCIREVSFGSLVGSALVVVYEVSIVCMVELVGFKPWPSWKLCILTMALALAVFALQPWPPPIVHGLFLSALIQWPSENSFLCTNEIMTWKIAWALALTYFRFWTLLFLVGLPCECSDFGGSGNYTGGCRLFGSSDELISALVFPFCRTTLHLLEDALKWYPAGLSSPSLPPARPPDNGICGYAIHCGFEVIQWIIAWIFSLVLPESGVQSCTTYSLEFLLVQLKLGLSWKLFLHIVAKMSATGDLVMMLWHARQEAFRVFFPGYYRADIYALTWEQLGSTTVQVASAVSDRVASVYLVVSSAHTETSLWIYAISSVNQAIQGGFELELLLDGFLHTLVSRKLTDHTIQYGFEHIRVCSDVCQQSSTITLRYSMAHCMNLHLHQAKGTKVAVYIGQWLTVPWDPGGGVSQGRLEGKPEFMEGGLLATSSAGLDGGPSCWAWPTWILGMEPTTYTGRGYEKIWLGTYGEGFGLDGGWPISAAEARVAIPLFLPL